MLSIKHIELLGVALSASYTHLLHTLVVTALNGCTTTPALLSIA